MTPEERRRYKRDWARKKRGFQILKVKHYPFVCSVCRVPKAADDFGKRRGQCRECRVKIEVARSAPFAAERSRQRRAADLDKARHDAAFRARKYNDLSRESAHNSRKTWTSAEMEYITTSTETRRTMATKLGRSIAAVSAMKRRTQTDPRYARLAGLDTGIVWRG